jgi:hypothetical protein
MKFEEFKQLFLKKIEYRFNKYKKYKDLYFYYSHNMKIKFYIKNNICFLNDMDINREMIKVDNNEIIIYNLFRDRIRLSKNDEFGIVKYDENNVLKTIEDIEKTAKNLNNKLFADLDWLKKEVMGKEWYKEYKEKKSKSKKVDKFGVNLKIGDYVLFTYHSSNEIEYGKIVKFTNKYAVLKNNKWFANVRFEKLIKVHYSPKKYNNEIFNEIEDLLKDKYPEFYL